MPRHCSFLGNVVRDGGDTAEAITCYRRALELEARLPFSTRTLIHQLQHQCAWDELPAFTERAIRAVAEEPADSTESPMSPFAFLTMPVATSSQQQQQCAARWAAYAARTAIPVQPWWDKAENSDSSGDEVSRTSTRETSDPDRPGGLSYDGRIRVGYLSADFRSHPVAELIVELFEAHDRNRFAITAYSYGPDDGSAMRRRMAAAFETFVDLRDMPLAESIQRIVDDRIDILVDLTGFTQHARTEILASRPAPIQVNYLGYPGTMGADFVDYIMVDDFNRPARPATVLQRNAGPLARLLSGE